tara:strand:- start:91 stop:687 length:597 start_codon:yes stop_codon:yes gene_type:complete
MPPKKKRRMREHPHVEQWMTISTLSQDIARYTKQQQQYVALLLQISELTQHNQNVPDNPWTGEQIDFKDVTDYILSWLDDFDANQLECKQQRDNALTDLKKSDVSDDNALKRLAAALTEAEIQLKIMDNFAVKWKKIVRFENGSLREHTEKWLKRWLKQWESTNTTKSQRLSKFQEALILVSQESACASNCCSNNPNM